MIIYEGIGGLVLFLAMAVLAIYFYGRLCRDAGYEEGRSDAYDGILDRHVIEPDYELELEPVPELTPGRHARTQPRQQAAAPPVQDDQDQRPPWYTQIGGPVQLPRGGAISVFLAKHAAAAPDTDTVLLPPSPAPALNGAADTGTMARVQLPDASTGAIRAAGDELVAKIERGELV